MLETGETFVHKKGQTLDEKLAWLYRRRFAKDRQGIRQSYRDLLSAMGNPHEKMTAPVIHVAGTNGKGSVIAYLKAILQAAGYNVHTYTSPHLIRYNERICLSGTEIENDYLDRLLDRILSCVASSSDLDFFEITTALAFTAFAETPADIILLETGLGGRYDCTNVVAAPLAAVVTSISYDHMDVLGNDLYDIAYEKAGIFKAGCPCFIGIQNEAGIAPFLTEQADLRACPVTVAARDWHSEIAKDEFCIIWQQSGKKQIYPLPALAGRHQLDNAALAVAVIKGCSDRLPVFDADIAKGLRKAVWPARLQKIMLDTLPAGHELWLDCGHNESAGQVLAAQIQMWGAETKYKPLHFVTGMLAYKDIEKFLVPLVPHIDTFTAVPITSAPGGASPDEMARIAYGCGIKNVAVAKDIKGLLENGLWTSIPEKSGNSGRILVAGSVYLAGEVLSYTEFDKKRNLP